MRKTFLGIFIYSYLVFGFAALGASERVVSLKNLNVDLPKIEFDIHLADGTGVAGYRLWIAYDPAQLKYVDTTDGDYLPTGGLFLRPALGADDTYIRQLVYSEKHGLAISTDPDTTATYALQLTVDDTTTIGRSVVLGEGEDAETFLVSDFFFHDANPIEEVYGLIMQTLGATPRDSHPVYLHVSVLRAAPMAADGDGRLATVSFDVLDPDMPIDIHLYRVALFDADETPLHATLVKNMAVIQSLLSDVNADGIVNLLDLTGVASAFGAPVTAANRRADVNADGEINILDLLRVANDLGHPVAGVVTYPPNEIPDEVPHTGEPEEIREPALEPEPMQ